MAHSPLKITSSEARMEVNQAWSASYSPERNAQAIESISDKPVADRIIHLVSRLFFRGIYFPQMGTRAWLKVIFQNRRTIFNLVVEGIKTLQTVREKRREVEVEVVPLPETPTESH
jgi:hypothetical protein